MSKPLPKKHQCGPGLTVKLPCATAEEIFKFRAKNPLGLSAQAEDNAPAYVFLVSNANLSYIAGTALPVMGGKTIGG